MQHMVFTVHLHLLAATTTIVQIAAANKTIVLRAVKRYLVN